MTPDEIILTAFYAAESGHVSERELAARLGVSREAALHSIRGLRQLGYVIETHPHNGCRLLESPDTLLAEDLRARLNAAANGNRTAGQPGESILVFERTTSTHDVVERLAREGHPEGLVVFAESQTAGRGRQGRVWVSPSRKGLWFSILLRSFSSLRSAQRLTVMAAVAVATALRKSTRLPLRIKWPNDILCGGRKVVGILAELSAEGATVRHAMLGIGINVNLDAADLPDSLRATATSLKLEAGGSFQRAGLAVEILLELGRCRHLLSDEKFPMLLERWLELDDTLGRQVCVTRTDGRRLRGLAADLDSEGALLIRTDEGLLERVTAGDVNTEKEIA